MIDKEELKQKIEELGNYAKVAKYYGVTRERIRQLAKKMGIDIMTLRRSDYKRYHKQKEPHEIKCISCGNKFSSTNRKRKCCSQECVNRYLKSLYGVDNTSLEGRI